MPSLSDRARIQGNFVLLSRGRLVNHDAEMRRCGCVILNKQKSHEADQSQPPEIVRQLNGWDITGLGHRDGNTIG